MANQTVSVSGGIGLGGLAFIVLFVLKLMGEIDLSWFAVLTSFIWVPLLCLLVVLAFGAAVAILAFSVAWVVDKLS